MDAGQGLSREAAALVALLEREPQGLDELRAGAERRERVSGRSAHRPREDRGQSLERLLVGDRILANAQVHPGEQEARDAHAEAPQELEAAPALGQGLRV